MDIKTVLAERGSTHGDFTDNADIAQRLKEVLRSGKHWDKRSDVEREAMEMVCSKLARAVSAEKYWADNFIDCSGYSMLVVERM